VRLFFWPKKSLKSRRNFEQLIVFYCFILFFVSNVSSISFCDELNEQKKSPLLKLTPCHLAAPGFPARIEAECGIVRVPENWDEPSGRQIELYFAVIRSNSKKVEPDPLFFFAGGPGQSATESYVLVSHSFKLINKKRDIILIDQRGTGQSNPLRCQYPENYSRINKMSKEEEGVWLKECLSTLAGNPVYYTTDAAVKDFEFIRKSLKYGQINIYGISYGTRVAFTYMKRYPKRVRSVILDGVLPQDFSLGPNLAADAQRSLDLIFARCEADPDCHKQFPDLKGSFDKILTDLKDSPKIIEIHHPRSGEKLKISFTYESFSQMVRLFC